MSLTELIKMFRETREKYLWFDSRLGWQVTAFLPKEVDRNAETYLSVSKNHILELTEKAEKMQKALEFYADASGEWGPGLVELDIKNNYQPLGELARKTLAELEHE